MPDVGNRRERRLYHWSCLDSNHWRFVQCDAPRGRYRWAALRRLAETRGETGLAGGIRVSKASVRVEAYGGVDELNAALGFARSICDDQEIGEFTHSIQTELFKIGSALATPPQSPKPQVVIAAEAVDRLTAEVHRLEAIEGMLSDWSLSGDHRSAAAFNLARTVCRRAERGVVRLHESGEAVQPTILALPEPTVRSAVALCAKAGARRRHELIASGADRQGRERWSRAW